SQATVSRIESADESPTDLRLLGRIGRLLNLPVSELFPDSANQSPEFTNGRFLAFCPNPFCRSNKYSRSKDGGAQVHWESKREYINELFEDTNNCSFCGTDLVKECPSCKKRLRRSGQDYCMACGTQIFDRPTHAEWEKIRKLLESGSVLGQPID